MIEDKSRKRKCKDPCDVIGADHGVQPRKIKKTSSLDVQVYHFKNAKINFNNQVITLMQVIKKS